MIVNVFSGTTKRHSWEHDHPENPRHKVANIYEKKQGINTENTHKNDQGKKGTQKEEVKVIENAS